MNFAGGLRYYRGLKGVTQKGLAEAIGANNTTISNWEKGISKPDMDTLVCLSNYFGITIDELIFFNEKSEKFKAKSTEFVTDGKGNKKGNKDGNKPKVQNLLPNELVRSAPVDNVFALRTDRLIERQKIPIYDMEAVAGLVPLFANNYSQQVVEFVETGLIPKCDGGLRIVGDSMYPLLKSGDVVFYKQIHDVQNNIIWGEMYLISFDIEGEEYIAVKYLQKSDLADHIRLVSHNEHHRPLDIHISRIRALAFIKASLRVNSIK